MIETICETWKPIPNSMGYEVSNCGNIRRNGKTLKICLWGDKYYTVRIRYAEGYKTKYVHRLVAEAFLPFIEGKDEVNHKDANKHNNNATNLEWCTRRENEIHAWGLGLKENVRAAARENVKVASLYLKNKIPVIQLSLDNEFIKEWDSALDVTKTLGIDCSAITKCCKGKLHKTGGYKWKYAR